MQERLLDEEGKLRPFKEWKKLVAPISNHHVGSWLKTEYDTAIIRAHQASQWQEFIANKDIFPNLRWMPTTSPSPEVLHKGFADSKLTKPVNDPFWEVHHPGNRWNCKCSLNATDEPETEDIDDDIDTKKPTAQRGLENNPKDGQLFSDKHPYFPENCNACPFYRRSKGVKNWVKGLFENREKDCSKCPHVQKGIDLAKIKEGEVYYNDEEYGERLQVSIKADKIDLKDNLRVAKAILKSFPEREIRIRPHIRGVRGVKNAELEIDKVLADNKKIEKLSGVKNSFKDKRGQNYQIVVIDFDKNGIKLHPEECAKIISRRTGDLPGKINECIIVYNGSAVSITTRDKEIVKSILSELLERQGSRK